MNEYPDSQLINLVSENNEDASDMLYKKYSYIVDIILNKYKRSARYLNIDFAEFRQEALVGFSDALVSYDQDKDVNLPTFITVCVERRLKNYMRKFDTAKSHTLKNMYSLDIVFEENGKEVPLLEKIGSSENDPQVKLEDKDYREELAKKIDEILSPSEKEVYELLLNDYSYEDIAKILNKDVKYIYNAISRIRKKIRSIL